MKPILRDFENTVVITLRLRGLSVHWKIRKDKEWFFYPCYNAEDDDVREFICATD